MLTAHDLLWGMAVPAALSLVLAAAVGGWRWGVALAMATAYMAGHVAIGGLPGPPAAEGQSLVETLANLRPRQASDWALIAALGAMLVGVGISCSCVSAAGVGLGRILLAFAIVNAVLWPRARGSWDAEQALVHVQAAIAIALVVWWSMDELADRRRGALVPLVLGLTAAAAAVLTALEGSQRLGQLLAVLAAGLLGCFLVALFRRSMDFSRGAMAVSMTVLTALLLSAAFYLPGYPLWAALTIALAPALAWVVMTPALRVMRPAPAMLLTILLVAVPLLAAIGPSVIAFVRQSP
jgi:hypothetical protein